MPLTTSSPRILAVALLVGLAPACKEDAPKTDTKDPPAAGEDEGKEAAEGKPEGEGKAATPTDPTAKPVAGLGSEAAGLVESAAAAAAGVPVFPHDNVLGHVVMPNITATTKKVQTNFAPPTVASMVDIGFAKGLAAAEFGPRGAVITNTDLTKPMGCAWVDTSVVEVPVACVAGYKGGATGLVGDLGKEGQLPDAKGHTAAYELEGETLYIDALGDSVVVSSHADLFALSKDYLQANLIDRAADIKSDVEFVLYAGAAMKHYADEIAPIFEEMAKAQAEMPGVAPTDVADIRARLYETEQVSAALGIESTGTFFRFAMHGQAGSETAKLLDEYFGGTLDHAFAGKLPASTFFLVAAHSTGKTWDSPAAQRGIEAMAKAYTEELGGDPTKLAADFQAFIEEEGELYDPQFGAGLTFVPGTLGGMVMEIRKEKPGREAWKAWTGSFLPKAILPADAAKAITWRFEPDATTIEGVAIDRWIIEPTAEGRKELERDSDLARVAKRWPSMSITVDRAELDDRVIFVLTPTDADRYMKDAVLAARGTGSVGKTAGYAAIEARTGPLVGLYAVDVAKGVEWIREIVPAEKITEIPTPLGNDLSDVYITAEHPKAGTYAGEFFVSQAFIEHLRKLGG